MKSGKRLDVLLAERGLCPSREKAKAFIVAGDVLVDGRTERVPSRIVGEGQTVEVRAVPAFVSRGGFKLAKAIEVFGLDLSGKICADFGASTGGFTDCMLKNGAARVYAVDVGYGQLAWSLRSDPRVVSMERTNARRLESLPEAAGFVSMDLSFISVLLVLPAALRVSEPDASVVALIKPQFEIGKDRVGKKGVVRDADAHLEVLETIAEKVRDLGLALTDATFSPVRGPNGNIEFPVLLERRGQEVGQTRLADVVQAAHKELAH